MVDDTRDDTPLPDDEGEAEQPDEAPVEPAEEEPKTDEVSEG
jgi:hypothetical protein